jgi:TonB family protein
MSSRSHYQEQTPVSLKLVSWLLLSLLLHGLILFFTYNSTPSGYEPRTLHINIAEKKINTPASTPKKIISKKPAVTSESIARREHSPPVIKKSIPVSVPVSFPAATPTSQVATDIEANRSNKLLTEIDVELTRNQYDDILRLIKEAVTSHYNYPNAAIRRGWQGEVTLAFTVESNGQIINIRIANSSGYPILDRAALASLNKVGDIRSAQHQPLSFELPILYHLQEG